MDRSTLRKLIPNPPAPLVLLHVASVVLPWILIVLGTKVHRYAATLGEFDLSFGVFDLFGVVGPDLLTFFLYGLAWTTLLAALPRYGPWLAGQDHETLPKRWWGRFFRWCRQKPLGALSSALAIATFHTMTVALLLLSVMEHGYYMLQHVPADGYMLMYALDNLEMLEPVLASKMTPALLAAMGSLGIFLVHPFLLRLLPYAKRQIGTKTTWASWWTKGRRRRRTIALISWLAGGVLFSSLTVDENLEGLQANGNWTIIGEAMTYGKGDYGNLDTVDLGDQLRLVATEKTQKHNVVLIVLESTRARSLKLYGSRHNTMPTLEALAQRGRWVRDAYTVVPHTSKALVAIHCGSYPKIVTPIDEAELGALPDVCLAQLLKEHGYSSAFFQPAEEGFEKRFSLVKNFGFDTFVGKESLPNRAKFHESSYFGFEDDIMIAPSLEWVDQQEGPFFLSLLTLTAHHKYTVPKGFETTHYEDDEELNNYLNTLAYTDRFLKKVIAGFEKRDLMKNTLFIILGDHGEGFKEHGRTEHDNVIYEEGLRVPWVLFGPSVPADGAAIEGLRQHIDLVPTVTDALGFELRGGQLPGKSLLRPEGHKELFFSCWYTNFCMAHLTGSKKTIFHYKRRRPQVFDLEGDSLEQTNIADRDGLDETVIEKLKRWKHNTNLRYEAHLQQRKTRFVSTEPPNPPSLADIRFEEDVAIVGFGVDKTTIKAGESFELATYFHALRKSEVDWKLFIHVKGPRKFINADHVPVSGAYPISQWEAGEYIEDRYAIHIDRSSPPGRYTVMMGLWNKEIKGDRNARAQPTSQGHEVDDQRRVHLMHIQVVR